MTTPVRASFTDIKEQVLAVIAEQWRFLLVLLFGMTLVFSALELLAPGATNFTGFVIGVVLGYEANARALADWQTGATRRRRYGTYFVVSLLTVVGALAGFLILVLPGLYLMARWSVASALVVAEDMSVSEALGASWRITQGSVWPITGAVLAFLFPVAVVIAVVSQSGLAVTSPLGIGTGNFISSLFSVGGWVLYPAIYRALRKRGDGLEKIFR